MKFKRALKLNARHIARSDKANKEALLISIRKQIFNHPI